MDRSGTYLREALSRQLTRRRFLTYAGAAFGVAALGACGPKADRKATAVSFDGKPAGEVSFANWPLYLDQAKDPSGSPYHPSLRSFSKRTGIQVQYHEVIDDYPSFFGKLEPPLRAGQATGYDLIVIGGREEQFMKQNGWLVELDPTKHPNFDVHATTWAKNRPWDPGNRYTLPYQAGFTGIAYNRDKVQAPLTKLDDLANPAKVGKSSVGMITQEMADLVMVNLGIDAASSGPTEWKEAAAWLQKQRGSGTVRGYYDITWMDELRNGNTVATMAWPGDIALYSIWQGYPQLEFLFPEGGALRWSDDMAIPAGVEHPVDASMLMDSFYQPEIAVGITEWVLYTSPVDGVQDLIRRDAERALGDGYKGYAAKLQATADNPYLFPDDGLITQTQPMRILTTDEELQEWNDIFASIYQS